MRCHHSPQSTRVVAVVHLHRDRFGSGSDDYGGVECFAQQRQFAGLHVFETSPHELFAEVPDTRIFACGLRVDGAESFSVECVAGGRAELSIEQNLRACVPLPETVNCI